MKKKIAFISEHASPLVLPGGVDNGGQNVYVSKVASHLAKKGYEVDIYTRWDNPDLDRVIELEQNVRVIHIEAGPRKVIPKEKIFEYMDEFTSDMVYFIEWNDIQYELVHAHFWMSGYVAALIKNILNIPYVITFHALGKVRKIYQGEADGFPENRFEVETIVAQEADMVFAECPQDKEDLMIHYSIKEEKIKIIPCGFDSSEFYPINQRKARLKLGLDPDGFVVLQLGRMVKRKGIDNVILAVSSLLKKSELPVELLIVGGETYDPDPMTTPEIGRLQQLALKEKIMHKVKFIGRRTREELKYFYNAANIFVTTPWYEPFGITPLEAMACGTPVIGSNVGGIKYSVEHGKTGFLVPPNDPEILSERLIELLMDPVMKRRFSLEALKRVNSLFTWDIVSNSLKDFYEKMMPGKVQEAKKREESFYGFFGYKKEKKLI